MESCSVKTEQLQRIEDSEERDDYVEIGIVKYPCYLESSLFGLTELFTVANRFARSHDDKQHSVIRRETLAGISNESHADRTGI